MVWAPGASLDVVSVAATLNWSTYRTVEAGWGTPSIAKVTDPVTVRLIAAILSEGRRAQKKSQT